MPCATLLSPHFIMTMMEIETTSLIIPFPTEINFQHVFTLKQKKKHQWHSGEGQARQALNGAAADPPAAAQGEAHRARTPNPGAASQGEAARGDMQTLGEAADHLSGSCPQRLPAPASLGITPPTASPVPQAPASVSCLVLLRPGARCKGGGLGGICSPVQRLPLSG